MLSNAYLADLVFRWSRILESHIGYLVDIGFRDAGWPKDQICKVWFV